MNSTIHFYFVSLFSYKIWWLNWDTKVMTGVGWRYEFHVTIPFHYRKLKIINGKRAKKQYSEYLETLELNSLDTWPTVFGYLFCSQWIWNERQIFFALFLVTNVVSSRLTKESNSTANESKRHYNRSIIYYLNIAPIVNDSFWIS